MVTDLNRVESDRAVILAGISHDLRTPLARMQLEVEMAQLSDDAREGMQSDLAQMDAIIGQFLEFAKPADTAQVSSIDVTALLTDCVREAERIAELRIKADIDKDINVFGNATDLKRIVSNLIENARRYGKTPDTNVAEIEIACRTEGNQAIIEIADNGPGIPETEMERLLRPFTRLDAARGQANGAGLGLAIIERIVKRHRGSLKLSNKLNGGLRIRISIPVTGVLS
jgi:two-component system, OmpR family, osmolarity sensor histidine kinase EnvZ